MPELSNNRPLLAAQHSRAVLSLRGSAQLLAPAIHSVLGLTLPLEPNTFSEGNAGRLIWVGPDDWFLIGTDGSQDQTASSLRQALGTVHSAVTDVSSGYFVLGLAGPQAREVLAQGCPLDLHPRVFEPGRCAGSVFFKAQVYLAMVDESPMYELLVRRSFASYVWQLIEATTAHCGVHRIDRA